MITTKAIYLSILLFPLCCCNKRYQAERRVRKKIQTDWSDYFTAAHFSFFSVWFENKLLHITHSYYKINNSLHEVHFDYSKKNEKLFLFWLEYSVMKVCLKSLSATN